MKRSIVLIIFICSAIVVAATGYKVGEKAADFKLKDINEKWVSLSDYKSAKGFIVVFTCNHCPFAQAYEERIMQLDKKYSEKGFPVIAINPNDASAVPEDSFENMVKQAKEKSYTFPYLYDETQSTASAYGATRTPHVFLLQKTGDGYMVKYIGAIDNNTEDAAAADKKYVEDAVDALINGTAIPLAETKAIGCTIKWKK
jgi:glutathione peroxidase-family protein